MSVLVVATRNRAKVAQLARLVSGLATVRMPAHEIAVDDAEIEAGADFLPIARRKALATTRHEPDWIVVATDGGLLIPALAGWQPARTKRFAGERATDHGRADALLALTAELTGEQRQIGWREAMAVARNGAVLASWVADSPPGLLATDDDPTAIAEGDGFWLPALWCCPEFGGKRLADLTPEERAARSDHWQVLGRQLRAWLATLADSP